MGRVGGWHPKVELVSQGVLGGGGVKAAFLEQKSSHSAEANDTLETAGANLPRGSQAAKPHTTNKIG